MTVLTEGGQKLARELAASLAIGIVRIALAPVILAIVLMKILGIG